MVLISDILQDLTNENERISHKLFSSDHKPGLTPRILVKE